MILRPYQTECINAIWEFIRTGTGNALAVMPTGSGKSCILAQIAKDVSAWNGKMVVLSHVRELISQVAEHINAFAPDLPIGIYSAGLKSKKIEKITVAGIQSAVNHPEDFGPVDIICIDEVHRVPPEGEGQYLTFLKSAKELNPHVRIIGLTATPFRTSSGMICDPEGLFQEICYEVGIKPLINQGFLCPLKTKASRKIIDTENLHRRGGEFVADEVEDLMDTEELVESACREILEYTQDRKSCLVFASGVSHAKHIEDALKSLGGNVATVFGETDYNERDQTVQDFRSGKLKYLVNVFCLSTGFDYPGVDCVAMLRPTLSPGLWYQCVGRGFRIAPEKKNCIVLDFGGNAMRHGPVDALIIDPKPEDEGQPVVKTCPQCQSVISAGYSICPDCGFVFPPRKAAEHDTKASEAAILSGEETAPREYAVENVVYNVHVKRGNTVDAPKTMRVDYRLGFNHWQSEWICFEHTGYALEKAARWWARRTSRPMPKTSWDAVEIARGGALAQTKSIAVKIPQGEKYARIVKYELGEKPVQRDEPGSDLEFAEVDRGIDYIDEKDIPF